MNYNELTGNNEVTFGEMPPGQFLLGQLSAFDNRYQACADSFFKEITWKQFFAIICINLCGGNPTINELSEVMGSSHQNVKQILLKLEKKDFVKVSLDEKDKRKQRISLTPKCLKFCAQNEEGSARIMGELFAGISDEQLIGVIKAINMMENNMKKIMEKENMEL